jgi:hypothetical protein
MANSASAIDDCAMSAGAPIEVVLAAHIPLLRIEAESVPFTGGDLWRMPFEQFNALTVGAFEDHRAPYEEVAPVFYRIVARPKLSNLVPIPTEQTGNHRLQMKAPSNRWSIAHAAGLGVIDWFQTVAVTPAWHALLLQLPNAALPPPRWSLSFAVADPGFGFSQGKQVAQVASIQGDADIEYLITSGFQTTTLDAKALQEASDWTERLSEGSSIDSALWPALHTLAECASPVLKPSDRAVLATAALESLLLPDVRNGQARTLAKRTAALLNRDAKERAERESEVRALYEARSSTLHGETPAVPERVSADTARGPALLATVICALDALHTSLDVPIEQLLENLDREVTTAPAPAFRPAATWSPQIQRARVSIVGLAATNLSSPEGSWLLWAPIAGLHCKEPMTLDGSDARLLLPLTGAEVLELEERDIRRDFASRLNRLGEHLAALCLRLDRTQAGDDNEALQLLEKERDLAVAALRLAGYHAFCDPAHAGPVIMSGLVRLRRPAVLRQSVWQMMINESAAVQVQHDKDEPRVVPQLKRLIAYAEAGLQSDHERTLSLYLRGFDRRFMPEHTQPPCISLPLAVARSFSAPAIVGDWVLVAALLMGRQARTVVCRTWPQCSKRHCPWPGNGDLSHRYSDALAAILEAAVPRAIDLWLSQPGSTDRPGRARPRAIDPRGQLTRQPARRDDPSAIRCTAVALERTLALGPLCRAVGNSNAGTSAVAGCGLACAGWLHAGLWAKMGTAP